jgi:hypothetical protein
MNDLDKKRLLELHLQSQFGKLKGHQIEEYSDLTRQAISEFLLVNYNPRNLSYKCNSNQPRFF